MLQEQLIINDVQQEYLPQLAMTMEQVVARGSLIEQFEDVQEEQKARFLIKLISVYNRQLERVRQ